MTVTTLITACNAFTTTSLRRTATTTPIAQSNTKARKPIRLGASYGAFPGPVTKGPAKFNSPIIAFTAARRPTLSACVVPNSSHNRRRLPGPGRSCSIIGGSHIKAPIAIDQMIGRRMDSPARRASHHAYAPKSTSEPKTRGTYET